MGLSAASQKNANHVKSIMNSGTQITMRGMGHILGIYMRAVNFRRNQYLGVYER